MIAIAVKIKYAKKYQDTLFLWKSESFKYSALSKSDLSIGIKNQLKIIDKIPSPAIKYLLPGVCLSIIPTNDIIDKTFISGQTESNTIAEPRSVSLLF